MLAHVQTWVLSDNQDGYQDGRHLSVRTCGHICISFIKLSRKFEYVFFFNE